MVSVEYELASRSTAFIRLIAQNEKRETFAPLQSTKVEKGRNIWKYAGTVKIPKKAAAVHLVAELYELVRLQPPDFSNAPAEVWQQMAKVRLPRRFAFTEVRFETREGLSATSR